MNGDKTLEALPIFAKFISKTMGLHFTKERLPELEQKLASLGRQAGYADVEEYLLWLMSAPLSREQMETLASTLTIGETYFLRDPKSFQVLEEHLLPEIISAHRATERTIRIWSAGCSTGEEPYSIAILLSRAIPDLESWKITLLASDINQRALEHGRRGVYSKWSFRNAPSWLMDYFTKREDGRFEIIPRIRKMVRFSHLNLADEGFLATSDGINNLDIIFCRNVMLYFDAAQIERTMIRFHAALRDTGCLFVGPTEVDYRLVKGFSCRHYEGAIVLIKGPVQQQDLARTPWPSILPQDKGSAMPAEKGAGAFPIARPPTPAPPAPLSPEIIKPGAKEMRGPNGYADALALYQAGRYEQSAERALNCLDAGQEQASALALAARAYANIGRFIEARECCEKAIACDRLIAQNHYLLSIILEQQDDTAGAVRSLKHALFIDHDYILAYFALGNLSRQCGEQRETERNFANALRLLERRDPHEVLPEAEGMTAGRLAEIIRAMTAGKNELSAGSDRLLR